MVQDHNTLKPGDTLADSFLLHEVIGQGGYGRVYRAEQLGIGRTVALKVFRPGKKPSPRDVERFLREAQHARSLEHPNTVRLYDFGLTDTGIVYTAWQYLDGEPLSEVIARGPLDERRVVRVASQILKSLMEAHDKGIIHRDIKPSNIFVCHFQGEPDFIKVLDFGVSKALVEDRVDSSDPLTEAGEVMGTPTYVSPEQVLEREVGPATDLYALGLLMAEALTGRAVMRGATPLSVFMAQASDDPVPLTADVERSALGSVIRRACEKKPEDRWPTARSMLDAVEEVGSRLVVTAHTELPPKRRRSWLVGGLGGLVIGALALGGCAAGVALVLALDLATTSDKVGEIAPIIESRDDDTIIDHHGEDPTDFPGDRYLGRATKIARQVHPDAELIGFDIYGVNRRGEVDLTYFESETSFRFRSPKLSRKATTRKKPRDRGDVPCLVYVDVYPDHTEAYAVTSISGCEEKILDKPRCPLREVMRAARREGAKKKGRYQVSLLDDGWFVTTPFTADVDEDFSASIPDRCR